ncbi:MAG: hypothetical protein R8M45_04290 [Ghiorsea sp.]
MNSKDFIDGALRTESIPDDATIPVELIALMSAQVELSNIIDTYKKHVFYGKKLDKGGIDDKIDALSEKLIDIEVFGGRRVPLPCSIRLFHGIIGLSTESSELIEAVTKGFLTGKFDTVNVLEELGDTEWYKAIMFDELGSNWETVRDVVIDKLKARYPEKFDQEKAENRDLDSERAILEDGFKENE